MKKNLNYLIAISIFSTAAFFSACDEKNNYTPKIEGDNPLSELIVPADFDWKTTNLVSFNIEAGGNYTGEYAYTIEVFDKRPVVSAGSKYLIKGFAKNGESFQTTASIPAEIKEVYIKQTSPTGATSVRARKVTRSVACNFGAPEVNKAKTRAAVQEVTITLPSFSTVDPAIFPTAAPSNAIALEQGSKWQGKNVFNVSTNIDEYRNKGSESTLYITENVTFGKVDNVTKTKVFILPGKTLTINNFANSSLSGWEISIGTDAALVVGKGFSLEASGAQIGKIYNKGTLTVAGQIHIKNSFVYNTDVANFGSIRSDASSAFYNLGEVNTDAWNAIGSSAKVYNGSNATIEVTNKFEASTSSILVNDGDMALGEFESYGSSQTQNNGVMTVLGQTTVNAAKSFWFNNGTWATETMSTTGAGNGFYNGCKLIVNDKLSMNATVFTNNPGAHIKTKDLDMADSHISMDSEVFIDITGTADFKENRGIDTRGSKKEGIYGTGENTALLRIGQAVNTYNSDTEAIYYSGNLQVACDNHLENRYSLNDGAELASAANAITIEPNGCNGDGTGEGGGDEPQEPDMEEPIVDPLTYSYIFEDQWPTYGDYDMNDIVVYIDSIKKYPNKEEKIEKISFEFSLQAVGANKHLAGAMMLNSIAQTAVKSVSYSEKAPTTFATNTANVEEGQTYAVIPLFDNAHQQMGNSGNPIINTDKNGVKAEPNTVLVEVVFNEAVELTAVDIATFNLFIISDINLESVQSNNRKEVHILGYRPTAKANTSLFGANDDRSSVSGEKYYVSRDNLTWAIMIPDAFKWPKERTNIKEAYPGFAGWVTSGGNVNPDWYKHYKSADDIYME